MTRWFSRTFRQHFDSPCHSSASLSTACFFRSWFSRMRNGKWSGLPSLWKNCRNITASKLVPLTSQRVELRYLRVTQILRRQCVNREEQNESRLQDQNSIKIEVSFHRRFIFKQLNVELENPHEKVDASQDLLEKKIFFSKVYCF